MGQFAMMFHVERAIVVGNGDEGMGRLGLPLEAWSIGSFYSDSHHFRLESYVFTCFAWLARSHTQKSSGDVPRGTSLHIVR